MLPSFPSPTESNHALTATGWRALALAIQSNTALALQEVYGPNLADYDDTLPESVKAQNKEHDNDAVLSYYRDRQSSLGVVQVRQCSLHLVGDGRAGKTTLARNVTGQKLPEDDEYTDGIETCEFGVRCAPQSLPVTPSVSLHSHPHRPP